MIEDQFSHLKISRQYRWQLRQKQAGRCSCCGQANRDGANGYCLKCRRKRIEQNRKRRGHKRRYRSLTWRLEQGQ